METVLTKFEQSYRKSAIPKVKAGDTVKVHQTVREGGKERVQLFEGTVIRVRRPNSLTASLTVRRLSAGVGVEKTYLLHSPNLVKVQVVKRGKVRRNYLSYLRERQGKATRLTEVGFDKESVNVKDEPKPEPKAKETTEAKAEATAKPTKAEAKAESKAEKPEPETKPTEAEQPKPTEDKVAAKKAKAEAFRKAQEAKQK